MSEKIHSIFDITHYFLSKKKGELTHLQLHKLSYFTQGYSLAFISQPIFEENIEAWEHGPVIREAYDRYRQFGSDMINEKIKSSKSKFSDWQILLMDRILDVYGNRHGFQLSEITHSTGSPWDTVYNEWNQRSGHAVIPHSLLKDYYIDQLKKAQTKKQTDEQPT